MSLTKVSYSMITGAPVNILDFGAHSITEVGYSTFDSTTAINAAITFALTFNGEVLFPAGTYSVTDTIQMFGSYSGQGVNLTGQGGGSSGSSRATLQWNGSSATAAILHLRGVTRCIVSNINLGSANIDLHPHLGGIFVQSGQPFGGPGSSNVQIKDCIVNGGIGANSYAVRLGENNLQVSECCLTNVSTQSVYSFSAVAYVTENGFVINSNNTKDMSFYSCSQTFFTNAGVFYEKTVSGWHIWENLGGGSSSYDFYINGNGSLTILGGGSEGSLKALKQFAGGSNPGTITMRGYIAEEMQSTDDFFIEMGVCNLVLDGCLFSCAAKTPKYIKYGDAALSDLSVNTSQSIISVGNWYREASDFIPVWSYGPINTHVSNSVLAPVRVFSTGDKGGDFGSIHRLKTVYGDNPQRFASLSYVYEGDWVTPRGLPYSASVLSVATVIQKYTIPYTYLKDASTVATIVFLYVEPRGKIVGVYANVTSAFILGAATVNFKIGDGVAADKFLLTKAISGFTGPIGEVDAELGTALARATTVQGGYIDFVSPTEVTATFISTSGNFGNGTVSNATAGNVDIYIAVQDFP